MPSELNLISVLSDFHFDLSQGEHVALFQAANALVAALDAAELAKTPEAGGGQ